jgi:ribosomal protein L12E/L44/L45/RPP1/RPP2
MPADLDDVETPAPGKKEGGGSVLGKVVSIGLPVMAILIAGGAALYVKTKTDSIAGKLAEVQQVTLALGAKVEELNSKCGKIDELTKSTLEDRNTVLKVKNIIANQSKTITELQSRIYELEEESGIRDMKIEAIIKALEEKSISVVLPRNQSGRQEVAFASSGGRGGRSSDQSGRQQGSRSDGRGKAPVKQNRGRSQQQDADVTDDDGSD